MTAALLCAALAALAVRGRSQNPRLLRPGVSRPRDISGKLEGAARQRYAARCDEALSDLMDNPVGAAVRFRLPGGATYTVHATTLPLQALAVLQAVEEDRQAVPIAVPGAEPDPDAWDWETPAARALYYRFLCTIKIWARGEATSEAELFAACPVPDFQTPAALAGYLRRLDEGRADALDILTGN